MYAVARTPQPPTTTSGGDRAAADSAPLIPSGMDGQSPPTDAVAPEALTVSDELLPPPPPLGAEDAPLVAPDTVAPEALTDSDEPPTPPPLGVEDALLVAPDTVAPEALTVSDEPPPPPLLGAEDAPLVVPDTVDASSFEASEVGAGDVVLTDELRDQIVKQVEYYFSDENLPTDDFLSKFVKKNKEGFVPIGLIASFRRMKKLVQDLSIIEAALRTSSKLVVSSDGKRIRRLHPLPQSELKDVKKRTVVVENLPSDFSMESIQETFGTVGKIIKITIHDPHPMGVSAASKKPDFMLSSKVHALVEYEAVEAAEKAVTTLNDGRNWRTGMKVRLLAKQSVMGSGKHNQSSKENQGTVSKKNNQGQPLKEEQQTITEKNGGADSGEGALDKDNVNSDVNHEEVRQLQKTNSKGGRKGRYRGQGKGQIQQNTRGQGHGSLPTISGTDSVNKPIPGPRMPDGTRGFTMGRGRCLPLQKLEKVEE